MGDLGLEIMSVVVVVFLGSILSNFQNIYLNLYLWSWVGGVGGIVLGVLLHWLCFVDVLR
jgi:hypothetical protein